MNELVPARKLLLFEDIGAGQSPLWQTLNGKLPEEAAERTPKDSIYKGKSKFVFLFAFEEKGD